MKIRALHISYKDVTKMKARTVMCEISVLSVGARDRWVAVSMMEKQWFRAVSRQGTETKCKDETEQQISPPLMRKKNLSSSLFLSQSSYLWQLTRADNLKLESGKPVLNFWSTNITNRKGSFLFSELSLAEGLSVLFLHNRSKASQQCGRITESQNSRGWKGPLWVI